MSPDTIEEVHVSGDFQLLGQLVYERPSGEVVDTVGIRLYRGVDATHHAREFLCIDDPRTQGEAWYRIDGERLSPVSLRGLENLPRDPR